MEEERISKEEKMEGLSPPASTLEVPPAENLALPEEPLIPELIENPQVEVEPEDLPVPVPSRESLPSKRGQAILQTVGVMILVGEGRSATSSRVQTLRNLFSDPMFMIQVVPWINGENENTQILNALTQAAAEWPTQNVILVKDSSVSNADSEIVTRKVLMGDNAQGWDLYYLCKWSDQCQKYVNVALPEEEIRAGGSYLAWTSSPYGVQAILFTPRGRDIVLGRQTMRNGSVFPTDQPIGLQLQEEILAGNMTAVCTVPNLFDYDISLATKNSDFLKLNECQPVPENTSSSGSSAAALLIFLLVVVLIILIGWALLRVGPR